jgi:Icc-related predicted phosphoesterase
MRILAVSDEANDLLYRPSFLDKLKPIDILLGCGDLPYTYMEYLVTQSAARYAFFVHGNHDTSQRLHDGRILKAPGGWVNIDRKVGALEHHKLHIAGLEGSIRYRPTGAYQYTESQMWFRAQILIFKLIVNRMCHGRALDVFITHAPPRRIHDSEEGAHRGFETFVRVIDRFHPRLFLHGHHHMYGTRGWHSQRDKTHVVNVHPYRILDMDDHRIVIDDIVVES